MIGIIGKELCWEWWERDVRMGSYMDIHLIDLPVWCLYGSSGGSEGCLLAPTSDPLSAVRSSMRSVESTCWTCPPERVPADPWPWRCSYLVCRNDIPTEYILIYRVTVGRCRVWAWFFAMIMMMMIENDYIAESMTVRKLSVDFVFMTQLRTSRSMSLKFNSNLSIV